MELKFYDFGPRLEYTPWEWLMLEVLDDCGPESHADQDALMDHDYEATDSHNMMVFTLQSTGLMTWGMALQAVQIYQGVFIYGFEGSLSRVVSFDISVDEKGQVGKGGIRSLNKPAAGTVSSFFLWSYSDADIYRLNTAHGLTRRVARQINLYVSSVPNLCIRHRPTLVAL